MGINFELHIPGGYNVDKRNVLMTVIISNNYTLYEPRIIMVVLKKLSKLYCNSVHWTSTSGHPDNFIKFPSCWDIHTTTRPLAPPHQGTHISLDAALPHWDTSSLGPFHLIEYPSCSPVDETLTSTSTNRHHLGILIHQIRIWEEGSAATKYCCSPFGHHVIITHRL